MLRDFINRIVELAAPTIHEIDGSVFSSKEMVHVMDKKPMPRCIDLTGLDSVCKMVRNEAEHVGLQIFIVAGYFEAALKDLIDTGAVVVIR